MIPPRLLPDRRWRISTPIPSNVVTMWLSNESDRSFDERTVLHWERTAQRRAGRSLRCGRAFVAPPGRSRPERWQ